MSSSNYRFTLNVQDEQSQVSLPVRLGDTNRSLYISMADGGKPLFIEDGSTAWFFGKKADETEIITSCIIEKNTSIRYDFTEQTASYPGIVDCEIRLYNKEGKEIASPRFIMVVDERVIYNNDIVSENHVTAIDQVLATDAIAQGHEATREANEETRVANEEARVAAESERQSTFETNESQRQSLFESAQSSRESEFENDEQYWDETFVEGEQSRNGRFEYNESERESKYETAEASRQSTFNTAESARVTAEKGRASAEQTRENRESTRQIAEQYRVQDENSRNTYEQARRDAEVDRLTHEDWRMAAENTRVGNENTRITNENARVSAEQIRAEAEAARGLRMDAVEKKVEGCTNAIKATASGEVVRADGVSTNEHTIKCKVKSDSNINLASVKVTRRGKNIIPYPYAEKKKTTNGVTITANSDGSVTINGTSTAPSGIQLFEGVLPLKGKYTLSGVTNTGEEKSHYLQPYIDGTHQLAIYNGSNTYDIDGNLTKVSLFINSGFTFNNVVVYPQLEVGTVATEYEAPVEATTYTPLADGTVEGIKSVAPTMTLFTDKEGVTIEVEYNQDINVLLDYMRASLRAILDIQNGLIGGEA